MPIRRKIKAMPKAPDGTLFFGDCLDILRRNDLHGAKYVKDESVDLIYLDPPFNSKKIYNVIFEEPGGGGAKAQIKSFEDIWTWNDNVAEEYDKLKAMADKVADTMVGLEKVLGYSNMFAYLVMMATRLVELRRALKPDGTIYLHCDQTAGHYIKVVMDAIFGPNNFRNEIVWCYTGPSRANQDFPRKHDVIFRYVKGTAWTFNDDAIRVPYSESFLSRRKYAEGKGGIYAGNRAGETEMDKYSAGKIPPDWWNDIPSGGQISSKELLGFETQKPEALLERIILASSKVNDLILDPFCGCGTAIAVAQKHKRKWIGIDITAIAIAVIKHRLDTTFPGLKYKVIGEPATVADTKALADSADPEARYQFQMWALGLDHARPTSRVKKGQDKGVDGRRYFDVPGKTEMIVYSIKSGKTGPNDVRSLCRVVAREKAAIGVFISMEPITPEMRKEAATMGTYQPSNLDPEKYPKVQVFSVEELMNGKEVKWPKYLPDRTFKPSKPKPVTTTTTATTLD